MDMCTIHHDHVALSALKLGPDAGDSRQRPCVFLHGLLTGNISTWYSVAALDLARDRSVTLYDLRGHGDSDAPAQGYDLNTQADDLLTVINASAGPTEQVDLIGHSLGALIALRFALRYPQRVGRLVLVDAPMPACEWVRPSLEQVTSPEALRLWLAGAPAMIGTLTGRRLDKLTRRLTHLLFSTSLLQDVTGMAAEPEAAMRTLECPVELIYGKDSPCAPVGEILNTLFPQSRLHWLECGHYIPSEAPQSLRTLLLSLLEFQTDHTPESVLP